MGSSLKVKEWWEGTVTLTGLKPTKLVKTDGCYQYSSKSSVTQSAQSLAKRLGTSASFDEPQVKKAAKKSVTKTKKSTSCTGTCSTDHFVSPPWLAS